MAPESMTHHYRDRVQPQEGQALASMPPSGRGNVLFIVDELCTAGGAERMLFRIIKGLIANGFSCRLVTFKFDPENEFFRNVPCPLSPLYLRRTYDLNAIRVARKLRQMIRSLRIDIVQTFHETSDLWGGMVARMSGCPVLVSSRRDMGIYRSLKHRIGYRLMNRDFDAVLAVSEEVRKFCIEVDGFSPDKVLTVYNGVELAEMDKHSDLQFRRQLGIPEDAPVITSVGNLRRVKGVDVLLRAAAQISIFIVAGKTSENDYAEELKQMQAALGLNGRVRFIGEQANVIPLLRASDVFCLPSRSEGFSNALIEAMACGLPCVATGAGGSREAITDGVDGYLVEPEDPQMLAARVMDLVRAPQKARELGRAARQTIERRFTFESMLQKITELYGQLIARRMRAHTGTISRLAVP